MAKWITWWTFQSYSITVGAEQTREVNTNQLKSRVIIFRTALFFFHIYKNKRYISYTRFLISPPLFNRCSTVAEAAALLCSVNQHVIYTANTPPAVYSQCWYDRIYLVIAEPSWFNSILLKPRGENAENSFSSDKNSALFSLASASNLTWHRPDKTMGMWNG